MRNYRNIQTMADLNVASKSVKKKMKMKGYEIEGMVEYVKEFYSPESFVAAKLNDISKVVPFDYILLKILRGLKKKLIK